MTIASAIQDLNDGILDAYTAVSTKGGTVPADKNIDNLPTAINSIQTGGGGDIEYDFLGCESHAEALYLENIMDEDILTATYKRELQWA